MFKRVSDLLIWFLFVVNLVLITLNRSLGKRLRGFTSALLPE